MGSIYGIGNPLMDIILAGTGADIAALGVAPGSMNLVSFEAQSEVIARCKQLSRLPGGSCANTVRAAAWLGSQCDDATLKVSYSGAVGADAAGDAFRADLEAAGVTASLARKKTPTGSSAIVVTPDYERTMFTYLGACREFEQGDLDTDAIAAASVLHVTGYMWDTANQETAAHAAIETAREGGVVVSFDLADPFVAERYAAKLRAWLPGRCRILFGNRAELHSLTGVSGSDDAVLRAAGRFAPQVIMKIGPDGCLVRSGSGTDAVTGERVEPRDTTGAGDAFAGGYLYGIVRGWPPHRCAQLANRIAAAVVTVEGCRYDGIDPGFILEVCD